MTSERGKGKAFLRVCENFRPVMHYFFLERFLQLADWFESRLSYTRSVTTSSMEADNDTYSSSESSQEAYEGNKDAARATLRVKQKLDGYEEGEMRSVQGQVQQLIQDVIDTNLEVFKTLPYEKSVMLVKCLLISHLQVNINKRLVMLNHKRGASILIYHKALFFISLWSSSASFLKYPISESDL